jgi:hypothetical protein
VRNVGKVVPHSKVTASTPVLFGKLFHPASQNRENSHAHSICLIPRAFV